MAPATKPASLPVWSLHSPPRFLVLSQPSRPSSGMKLRLPSASARARTIIVAGTLFGAVITGGWLLQRGSRTGMFTAYEGQRLFDNVLQHVQNEYVDSVSDSLLYRKSVEGMLYELND